MAKKNPAERFIHSNSKYIRVLAGPGAGKSYSLKERLKVLVNDKGIKPERILALTFTSVAAQDLKQDIRSLGLGDIEVSTLHALALKLLSRDKGSMRLLLGFEVDTMLRDLEPELGKFRGKEAMLRQYRRSEENEPRTDSEKQFEASLSQWLKQHRGFVMDDLIPCLCDYLDGNKVAQKRLSYDCILVDEYQDLNPDEQRFVELLLSSRGKFAVIGDDDQSIYEFKGGSPEGIRAFVSTHPDCEDIRFTECYRCPAIVVELAKRLIEKNHNRIEKEFTARPEKQMGSAALITSETPEEELDRLCDTIRSELSSLSPGQIVVLTPTKTRGRALYDALQNAGIPAAFCFRDAVFDSKAAREHFSLLSLAADPSDLISWRYLLGGERGDRCAASYRRIRDAAKKEKRDILAVLEDCASSKLTIPYTYALVKRYRKLKSQLAMIQADPDELSRRLGTEAPQYAEILDRAIKAGGGFAAIRAAVLNEVFSPEAAAASDRVRIMSLHAAKGLSAEMVVIMSAVEDLIPLKGKGSIEEQRRLFYVAITRCKGGAEGKYQGKLIVSTFTHSEDGEKTYQPTRFVEKMGL